MGPICRNLDSGSGGAEATALIQYIDGREPKIYELLCLGLYVISHEVHPTAHVEGTTGTVGEFFTNYLSENGRQIKIIGQLSVNNSVQVLGFSDQAWGIGLPFICNILAHVKATGWEVANNFNQNLGGRLNNANIITNSV